MIDRSQHLEALEQQLAHHPVVAILGARQVGKTTLARQLAARWKGPVTVFDLEDPADLEALENPKLALEPLDGLVVLDEIQRRAELFPLLRVLVDRAGSSTRFLLLGSASPDLVRRSSESLAGRILYHELEGFSLDEVGGDQLQGLWIRGGFPRSFLAVSEVQSQQWREGFVRTFLEHDLPDLGIRIPPATLRRFWSMLAHYHGQVFNAAELGRALGTTAPTIRRYLDLLTSTFVVRQLSPWFENLGKRQVKSPKIYLTDSGLLHTLLGIDDYPELLRHPKIGASWEGFALVEVVRRLGLAWQDCYFWTAHTGGELDLLAMRGTRRLGFEFKRADAPRTTRSMHAAIENLKLDRLDVIYPGSRTYALGDRIRAVPLKHLFDDIEPLRRTDR